MKGAGKAIIIGSIVFVLVMAMTHFLVYQRYLIEEKSIQNEMLDEVNKVQDRFESILSSSFSATKTLAFMISRYGDVKDFDEVAKDIIDANGYIDIMELTDQGVITHIYPLKGNERAMGFNIFSEPERKIEAYRAVEKRELFFAGPLTLKQGGEAIIARYPIFKDDRFIGFSIAIIRMSTFFNEIGIDTTKSSKFVFHLSKVNSATGREEFFLPRDGGLETEYRAKSTVKLLDGGGGWNLSIMMKDGHIPFDLIFLYLFGFLLAVIGGIFAWHLAKQPEYLAKLVESKTLQLAASVQKAQTAQRLYHVVSRINHAMMYVPNERELFREACHIAVDFGKFRMAWIGLIDEEGSKVQPVMHAGEERGYLSQMKYISLQNGSDPVGLTATTVQTGRYTVCNDIATDPAMQPWTAEALARDYRSVIVLPIKRSGRIIGTFNLYTSTPHFFDQKRVDLLIETSENISFTLDNFEKELRRKRTEEQIVTEKTLSESIINSLPGVLYIYDIKGRFLRWNKNFSMISGYSDEEIAKMHPVDFFGQDEKIMLREKINDVFSKGKAEVQAHFCTKDGQRIPYFFNGRKVSFGGIDYLIGMGIDISDRVSAENELLERTREIKKLTDHMEQIREEERTRIAREIHDELGQQLTGLKLNVHWIRKKSDPSDEQLMLKTSDMLLLIDDTIKTVRRIASELRPGILDDLGLMAAIEWQGQEFEKRTGIKLTFSSAMNDFNPEKNLSTNIFRIYQEALTNIARHAHATLVETSLEEHDHAVVLKVKDNGTGFDVHAVNGNSLGLIGMKERAMSFNGDLQINSGEGKGTEIILTIQEGNKT